MALNEFDKKGFTPLSYRSHREYADGSSQTIEYENPAYTNAKAKADSMFNRGRQGKSIDSVVSRLYGSDVVIHTRDGYHYGRLVGYDSKGFMLEYYHFDKRLMNLADYFIASALGEDTVVPADGAISVSKIPLLLRI